MTKIQHQIEHEEKYYLEVIFKNKLSQYQKENEEKFYYLEERFDNNLSQKQKELEIIKIQYQNECEEKSKYIKNLEIRLEETLYQHQNECEGKMFNNQNETSQRENKAEERHSQSNA